MISTSPLRYPGGKARFTNFILNSIKISGEIADIFVEPFCGGAGAAIALLESGHVKRIALNDIDPLVSSFWQVVFGKSCNTRDDINWLINAVESVNISIDEWRQQKNLKPQNIREAAWKCLFINRTSFNGILHKSGPIGGWKQENRSIDVRFNKEKIIEKLINLYYLREQVERVDNSDWRVFCTNYQGANQAYIYIDPPYYHRAERLYVHVFDHKTHLELRNYLVNLVTPWMLSYDDTPEVRDLYSNYENIYGCVIDQTYSTHPMGGNSFIGRELFFSNRKLPCNTCRNGDEPHIGMSIVGSLNAVPVLKNGPIRIPFKRNAKTIDSKSITTT